jgi:hypothetical protein
MNDDFVGPPKPAQLRDDFVGPPKPPVYTTLPKMTFKQKATSFVLGGLSNLAGTPNVPVTPRQQEKRRYDLEQMSQTDSPTPVTSSVEKTITRPFEMIDVALQKSKSKKKKFDTTKGFKEILRAGPGLITGGVKLGLAPFKILEPGVSTIVSKVTDKKTQELGQSAIAGAEKIQKNILIPVAQDMGLFFEVGGRGIASIVVPPSKRADFVQKTEQRAKELSKRPTSVAVTSATAEIISSLKKSPGKFFGELAGGVLVLGAMNKAIQPAYSQVMKSSFQVGQKLKTVTGVIDPVYVKETKFGVQAIKPQTDIISKSAFKEKIQRLGYKKAVQGVVYKDQVGREFIPVTVDGRPRAIALTYSRGDVPFSSLNVSSATKELKPYFKNLEDQQKYTELLKKLKQTKSNEEIKQISQQINKIDLKWGKQPPEVYTEQSLRGFGESFESQLTRAGQYSSLGTGQRNLFEQFKSVGTKGEKFLRVSKPSVDPTERAMFFTPKYQTQGPGLRVSRLGSSEPSLFELFSKKATLGIKPKSEIFITKGTKIADIPASLKPLSVKAKTDIAARIKFQKIYKPIQLTPTQQVKPFGFINSSELEVILPEGGVVGTKGLVTRAALPGASKTTPIYQLFIPKNNLLKSTIQKTSVSKTQFLKSIPFMKSRSITKTYDVGRLVSEITTSAVSQTPKSRTQPFITTKINDKKSDEKKPSRIIDEYISPMPSDTRRDRTESVISDPIIKIDDSIIPSDEEIKRDYKFDVSIQTPPSYDIDPPRVPEPSPPIISRITPSPPVLLKTSSTTKLTPPQPTYHQKKVIKTKQQKAFNIQVRSKGKWRTIPQTKKRNWYAAHEHAMKNVDYHVERSYRLIPTKKKANVKKNKMPLLSRKFYRRSKTKNPSLKDAFIEKSKHAIDSVGELRGITWKGLKSIKSKRNFI